MTYNMLYRHILSILKKAGCDAPAFDTLCLFENVCNMNRHSLIMEGDKEAPTNVVDKVTQMAEKRSEGYPLQYLIGMWNFMDLDFFVGDGVLIPREDTSVVVELCIENIYKSNMKNPKILDLCAGSGAISIALDKKIDNSNVTALELSEKAMEYLKKNIEYNKSNVTAVYGDVFKNYEDYENATFDVIISNPPYIIHDEIKTLQKEVQYEPKMALDGGSDGYDFYREIVIKWGRCIKKGGLLVFELGEGQFDTVEEMMKENGFDSITYALDIQNIKRGISGVKC